ncbi:MAG TPA: S8 family serine peptidase [Burkholderiaceae bacterium]|nr:S8 family serine peptidase [Burkholderiaceae bacterium]HQR69436.1 S8 family serine peptidase [Burkholderiaceae bacterium]
MWSVQRFVFVALAGAGIAWPASVALSTDVMTPKQAALQGLTATKKVREERVDKLIVRLRPTEFENEPQIRNSRVQALSTVAGAQLKSLRRLASGSHLLQLDRAMTVAEARAMSARLMREGDVEYAEPDILFKKVVVPNEKRFAEWQWNLFAPTSSYSSGGVTTTAAGGANLPPAWDLTQGSDKVTIAIIDTGITNHQDLNGIRGGAVYIPAGRFLPGYDFVSSDIGTGLPSNFIANDGNGRDADPTDPGDWITADDKTNYPTDCDDGSAGGSTSSWHGTHMAGIAAATANNAEGIAGIGWNVKILPVRALGKCGGSLSDIADAIRWAAGAQPDDGRTWQQNGVTVGTNPNPAQVISLSLGGDTVCSAEMQRAVTAATTEGAIVVAATGNDGVEGLISPAICSGVVAVTAHAINGENADYANIGVGTTLSAPGGGQPTSLGKGSPIDDNGFNGYYIHSTVQFGDTTPTSTDSSGNSGPAYAGFVGTSPATPHVAGVAALMKSIGPDLTPTLIKSYLQSATRPYPAGSACAPGATFDGKCGTGLLDAERALLAVPDAIPAAVAGADQVVTPGSVVTLDGTKSRALSGKTLTAYEWTQTAGTPTVTLTTPNAAVTTFTAPASGSLTFRLRVTDSQSKVGEDSIVVHVNSPPVLAAAPPAQSVPSGGLVLFTVSGSDADGDALTYVASALSTVPLSALSPSGQFIWNTTGIPPGNYQLTYFVTDGVSQSATQSVPIVVSAANLGSSGGGGGALAWLQLLLLAALLVTPAVRQRIG